MSHPPEQDPGSRRDPPPVRGAASEGRLARRRSDGAPAPLIPDCCDQGIAARILMILNAGAVLAALLHGRSPHQALVVLAEVALVLEPAAILTIWLLCRLRPKVNERGRGVQWTVALLVPAVACALVCAWAVGVIRPDADGWTSGAWIFGRTLLAVAISLAMTEYFRLRGMSLSPSLSEARLQALQARIRPHFLFNSLNSVLALMRGDPRRAEQTLENLADLFRVFMRDTRDMVPIDEEVATCRRYLEIEQLRLGERLAVQWDVDGSPSGALVPSLLLQPLLENAVHHGVEPSPDGGEVAISVRQVGERVRVEIANSWDPAWTARHGSRSGLANVRERLMLLYDTAAFLRIAVLDRRFIVLLEFPCRKERRRRGVQASIDPDR